MTARRPPSRWWGWGEDAHGGAPAPHAQAWLRAELGFDGEPRPPVPLDAVDLGDRALPDAAATALAGVVGAEHVRTDREARVLHAAGKSYPDLIRQRAGDARHAPEAVVLPGSPVEVFAVLERCAADGIAVVPFGGGTSVVGGVEPDRGPFAAVIALDLARLDRLAGLDERSLLATFEPGIRGPEAETELARRGLTLGHFPQSFEYASVGGMVATRSAGQASTGYGRIDELVRGLRLAAPAGEMVLPALPPNAAGPDLRQLVAGSEGVLGVLTEVTLSVRPRPAVRRYEGFFFKCLLDGVEAFRALEQGHAAPDVARLSDEHETRASLAQAGGGGAHRLVGGYLRARGFAGGCLAILGWEGYGEDVARRRARSVSVLRRFDHLSMGRRVGDAWERNRYHGPYLRDELLTLGVMAETLETTTTWSGLMDLYAAVHDALRTALTARGTPPLVLCHVSHAYESGASLYFTFLARQERGAELEQWRAAKSAACEAIVAAGGSITHHHAVGRDHAPYVAAETSALGQRALRAVKAEWDPAGILNPGKLLSPA